MFIEINKKGVINSFILQKNYLVCIAGQLTTNAFMEHHKQQKNSGCSETTEILVFLNQNKYISESLD